MVRSQTNTKRLVNTVVTYIDIDGIPDFIIWLGLTSGEITQYDCDSASHYGFSDKFGVKTSVLIKSKNRRELGVFIEVSRIMKFAKTLSGPPRERGRWGNMP